MRKIQRILVAVKSPGEQWSPAAAKAAQIARATGARLELRLLCGASRIGSSCE